MHDKTFSLWYSVRGSSATKVTHSQLVKLQEATSPCHNKILSFSSQVHHKVTGTISGCAGVESWGPYIDSRYGIWNMQEANCWGSHNLLSLANGFGSGLAFNDVNLVTISVHRFCHGLYLSQLPVSSWRSTLTEFYRNHKEKLCIYKASRIWKQVRKCIHRAGYANVVAFPHMASVAGVIRVLFFMRLQT